MAHFDIPRCFICNSKRQIVYAPKKFGMYRYFLRCGKCNMIQPIAGNPFDILKRH